MIRRLLSRVGLAGWAVIVTTPAGERFRLPTRHISFASARVRVMTHALVMGDGYSYEIRWRWL